jgi:hypothetical protein
VPFKGKVTGILLLREKEERDLSIGVLRFE